ncbi:MAG: hypothetical protein H7X84_03620 [Verrucomicrobia bacterium]|nr:hypothetical protein [Prolixibacteraceae bacterium]
MKPLFKTASLFLLILLNYSCAVRQQEPVYTQDETVDFQLFYDQLSPYGQWVNYSNYGYVWMPDVRRDFAPYSTNGHWVMSDYGWTWVSDYRWGWAAFHYGRWDFDNRYGWFWVPDNDWGPAWVTWRSGDGYYGWAPMRPGMGISNSFNEGYRDINRWNFIRDRDFGRRDIHRYYINRGNYSSILEDSRVIDHTTVDRRRNTTYVAGPPAENVERVTGRAVNRVRIQDYERPGQKLDNEELRIYRPRVRRTAGNQSAPSKVTDLQDIKPVKDRGTSNTRNNVNPIEDREDRQQTRPQQQVERRRSERMTRQQQTEKSQPMPQAQPQQPTFDEQEQPSERRRLERQRQNQQIRQEQPNQSQQQTVPSQSEGIRIQQEQVEKQDRTRQEQQMKQQEQQIRRQEQQVERQQQQLEKQQQQQQRRQERQQIKQQQTERSQQLPQTQPTPRQEQEQKYTAPSGSRRR